MNDEKLQKAAFDADFIVNGYAYTRADDGSYRVLNLNNRGESIALLREDGEMLETNMDDIELGIAADYLKRTLPVLMA